MAITLTILLALTAVRHKVLMVSLEVTGNGKEKNSQCEPFLGLFTREKETADLTELFIYLRNTWNPKYWAVGLDKDALGEPGLLNTSPSFSWTLTRIFSAWAGV